MIKYVKNNHSFSYDGNPGSSEMPSLDSIKKDKYGNIICRMLKQYSKVAGKRLFLRAEKYHGDIHFSIISGIDEHYASACSLKTMFENLVSDEYVDLNVYSLFAGMSYDEVLVKLDLIEAFGEDDG